MLIFQLNNNNQNSDESPKQSVVTNTPVGGLSKIKVNICVCQFVVDTLTIILMTNLRGRSN